RTVEASRTVRHEHTATDLPGLLLPPARSLRTGARTPMPYLPLGGTDSRAAAPAEARPARAARGRDHGDGLRRLTRALANARPPAPPPLRCTAPTQGGEAFPAALGG